MLPLPLAHIDIDPYAFACDGDAFGIPHFVNVVTNVPFLFVGAWGLWVLARAGRLTDPRFFNWVGLWVSTALLILGSGAYHWFLQPWSLAADRLCIAGIIAFLGAEIAAATLRWGPSLRLSLAFLAVCVGTVVFWMLGGTSWLYGALQGLGGLGAIALAVWAWRAGRVGKEVLGPVLAFAAFYALAKVAEVLDVPVCELTGWIGGHPIKHLLSAAGLLCLVRWMRASIGTAPAR